MIEALQSFLFLIVVGIGCVPILIYFMLFMNRKMMEEDDAWSHRGAQSSSERQAEAYDEEEI